MKDINFSQMQEMQKKIWERNKNNWRPVSPEYARESLLWMMEEIGEVVAIIKKKGDDEIMQNTEVRAHFTEEIADMLMYLNDVLMRYQISPEEIATAYQDKHERNMSRDFPAEHAAIVYQNHLKTAE